MDTNRTKEMEGRRKGRNIKMKIKTEHKRKGLHSPIPSFLE